jgi:hypothetical protein
MKRILVASVVLICLSLLSITMPPSESSRSNATRRARYKDTPKQSIEATNRIRRAKYRKSTKKKIAPKKAKQLEQARIRQAKTRAEPAAKKRYILTVHIEVENRDPPSLFDCFCPCLIPLFLFSRSSIAPHPLHHHPLQTRNT